MSMRAMKRACTTQHTEMKEVYMSDNNIFDTIGSEHKPKPKNRDRNAVEPNTEEEINVKDTGKGDKRRWGSVGDIYHGLSSTHEILPTGLFNCKIINNIGPALEKRANDTDDLIRFPDSDIEGIINEFHQFWEIEKRFRERGFLHKRGFLLYGPPGSGKTSCVQLLIKSLIDSYEGIVVMIDNPEVAAECLAMLRKVEKSRPIIGIIEDIDAVVDRYDEDDFLSLLDGERQVDNVIFVATTNYPERLDPRFIDRPSRFDTIKLIDMPNAASREIYLSTKEKSLREDAEELEKWVKASKGFSVAHLKEMIIAIKCFDQDFDSVVERLSAMQKRKIDSAEYDEMSTFGFMPTKNKLDDD